MLEQQIEADIKAAMLARDSERVLALRQIKSVLLNVKVANGTRDTGLADDVVITLLAKEAKKRQESADLYIQGGNQHKADQELAEKNIIEAYLPAQLSEAAINDLIDQVIAALQPNGMSGMGQVIGAVKAKAGATADGGVVARLVKSKLAAE
jgi:uncharacterized protein YqeY